MFEWHPSESILPVLSVPCCRRALEETPGPECLAQGYGYSTRAEGAEQ
jgi:hypothetical protein